MECELPQKLDILWSFIKTHLKVRLLAVFTACWPCVLRFPVCWPCPERVSAAPGACRAAAPCSHLSTVLRALRFLNPLCCTIPPHTTPQAKTIIFVSTCKQVRFLFEAFRKLRPGVPLRALHGKMAQIKRMSGERGPCSMLDANHSRGALVLPVTAWCFIPCLLHC